MNRQFNHIENRLEYAGLLMPPEGYEVSFAVGMTYSLELNVLLTVPLAFGLMDEIDVKNKKNQLHVLEALRKYSDKIALFYNAEGILPRNINLLQSLLEKSLIPVQMHNEGVFHPKLWVVKYTSVSDEDEIIRIIVLSRNITYDRCLDIAVEMMGEVANANNKKHEPLKDMMTYLANQYADGEIKKRIIDLANDVMKVKRFVIDDQYEDYDFIPFGIEGYRDEADKIFADAKKLIVVSPFLSEGEIKKLTKNKEKKVLFSRALKVTQEILDCFDQVYVPKTGIENNQLLEEVEKEDEPRRELHAKIIYTQNNMERYLYLGSLNATHSAFHRNIEFMLKLKFNSKEASYEEVLADLLPEHNCLFELLKEASPDATSEDDEYDEDFDCTFEQIIDSITGAEVIDDGDKYSIKISSTPITEEVKICPIHVNRSEYKLLEEETVFMNLTLDQLSELYFINFQDKERIIKINTLNIPKDREKAIYNTVISDKSIFIEYMLHMLSDNYATGDISMEEYEKVKKSYSSSGSGVYITPAVYELLLTISYTDPEKLDDVIDMMNKMYDDKVDDALRNMVKRFKTVAMKEAKKRNR